MRNNMTLNLFFYNMTELELAIIKATEWHSGQIDKCGAPYILHPLAVALKCKTEKEKIVAFLHDVVEDCNVRKEDLDKLFNKDTVEAIIAISKKRDEKYFDYIDRVKKNKIAKAVKIQDIIHNMSRDRANYLTKKEANSLNKRYKKALGILCS